MVALCAPAGAAASPLLDQIGASGCTLVADPTLCTITVIDSFADMEVTGELVPDNGVALFAFELTDPTTFSVFTTSATSGFDPALGLFHGDDSDPLHPLGNVVTYSNAEGEFRAISYDIDTNTNFDAQLLDLTLDAGVYLLALVQYPNEFKNDVGSLEESLQAGFTCDDPLVGCAFTGGTYTFTIDVDDGVPAPVPEPGTLTLMAGGALAGLIRRRRSKKRNRSESVSR
jgi:hypothetical protein